MADEGTLDSFSNLFLSVFLLLWYLVNATFTGDRSTLIPPPPPLRQKPQKQPLSLPLIPTKYRCDCSNGRILRALRTQKNKIFTSKHMIILDGVSCYPHCAMKVEIPELDRELIHVGVNPNLSQVIIYKIS